MGDRSIAVIGRTSFDHSDRAGNPVPHRRRPTSSHAPSRREGHGLSRRTHGLRPNPARVAFSQPSRSREQGARRPRRLSAHPEPGARVRMRGAMSSMTRRYSPRGRPDLPFRDSRLPWSPIDQRIPRRSPIDQRCQEGLQKARHRELITTAARRKRVWLPTFPFGKVGCRFSWPHADDENVATPRPPMGYRRRKS